MPIRYLEQRLKSGYRFLKTYGQHLPLATKAIFQIRCEIRVLRGSLPGSTRAIDILYVGRGWNDAFLERLLLEDCVTVSSQRATLFSAGSGYRAHVDRSDVLLVDIGWPYAGLLGDRNTLLEIADWIDMGLSLAATWPEVKRSFRLTTRRNDLRLVRRNGYRYELSNDEREIDRFYDDMYLPTTKIKHGNAAIVAPRRHVRHRAKKGALLQVFREDDPVISGVVYVEDDVLYFLWYGFSRQHQQSPPEAAVSALYLFGIRYAFDIGVSHVDFAGTRPFLDYGDFRFKRKWGGFVDDTFSPSAVLIGPLNDRDETVSFFENLPLIARSEDGLEARIVRQRPIDSQDGLQKINARYGCDGLERVVVTVVGEGAACGTVTEVVDGRKFRVTHCPREHFRVCYAQQDAIEEEKNDDD